MRILFWGTPEFAIPSLRALLGEGHEVVGVVTQPDRPAGRGRTLHAPPVKTVAQAEGLLVLQPEKARGEEFRRQIAALRPEISVVVAYGQILKRDILDVPARGSINVHASLLPELRGAAPINWAIIRGHERTGVTVMRMVEEMDAGPILLQVEEPIGPDETASDLAARLSEVGAAALIEALVLLEAGELEEVEQDHGAATYAPRITRADARIDWSLDAVSVARWMRGLDEQPGAWTMLRGQEIKVYRPLPVPDHVHDAAPGTVLEARAYDPAQSLLVACGRGAVWVREVKPAGRRRMTSAEWLRGRAVAPGDRFD
ncbi:MAG: methionyl-tRNA formyltransferase [bacterium]|jgi:methionyl-tRNA formyltransferase|nr:MAG: methionyl-tRNA formyltransferase [bacterium]